MASTADGDKTPLDGSDFLVENRAKRQRIRDDAVAAAQCPECSRPSRLVVPLGAAVAVLVVAVGVLAYLVTTTDRSPAASVSAEDRAAIVSAAREYAAEILTYRAGHYDDLDTRIRAIATPEFADRYIRASGQARKANDEAQASSTATAEVAGLVSVDGDEAVVLVALDQHVTSPQAAALGAGGETYQSRVKVTLIRDGDRWLVTDLDAV